MKIEKAIKLLAFWETLFRDYHDQQLKDALKLGIEALKARKVWQDNEGFDPEEALPGETKD